ncbi:MAG TPA: hypothetical protein VEA37_05405 [Flavobacterium sp.]|nr:hypothetical protein [Flavobacterium sp.]
METKRVYELKKGDIFINYGRNRLVTFVNSEHVRHCGFNSFGQRCEYETMGAKSQRIVEIVKDVALNKSYAKAYHIPKRLKRAHE